MSDIKYSVITSDVIKYLVGLDNVLLLSYYLVKTAKMTTLVLMFFILIFGDNFFIFNFSKLCLQ